MILCHSLIFFPVEIRYDLDNKKDIKLPGELKPHPGELNMSNSGGFIHSRLRCRWRRLGNFVGDQEGGAVVAVDLVEIGHVGMDEAVKRCMRCH